MSRPIGCALFMLAGCVGEAPPYEELPLRDALGASPEVIASLSAEARGDLAARFEDARRATKEEEEVHASERGTPPSEVRELDTTRAARGEDALVLAAIESRSGCFAVRSLAAPASHGNASSLPELEGPAPADETEELELRAFRGQAGVLVAGLAADHEALHVVRVVGWPIGLVASGDAVYVNASWLVALESLDPRDAAPAPPPSRVPAPRALSIGGSPYAFHASLAACAADVGARCKSCLGGGECDDRAALEDFADARSECQFLSNDEARAAQLCALALLTIGSVAECVEKQAPECGIPGGTTRAALEAAGRFLEKGECFTALDICLGGPGPSSTGGSGGDDVDLGTSGCEDPFSSCASSCKGCKNSCKTGSCSGSNSSSSCSSCDGQSGSSSSCDSCSKGSSGSSSSGCKSCSGGSGSSGGCKKCHVHGGDAHGPPPVTTAAWLLAPLALLGMNARRRARRPS